MKRHIRQITEDGKSVQITTVDERWYIQTKENGSIVEYPSVTWIVQSYPKGIGYMKWLAQHGWDDAEAIKEAAGDRGHKVHQAITSLLLGNSISMDDTLRNSENGADEEIGLEEYEAIMSFADWFKEAKPKTIQNELTVFNDEHKYAGTVDYICEMNGERWLIDFKTSANIWPSYELQLSAYAHALPDDLKPKKLAILQVGYGKNRKGFKFTEVEDQFDLFLATHRIWQKEHGNAKPHQKDYPTSISL